VATAPGDSMMVSVLLRHDQSLPLAKQQELLAANGHYENFPPHGVEVVSWYVMMGLGKVVTLRFPANRLREINRAIETTAWGAFRTEIYATYDFVPIAAEQRGGKLTRATGAIA
jgi:hypothetical protein